MTIDPPTVDGFRQRHRRDRGSLTGVVKSNEIDCPTPIPQTIGEPLPEHLCTATPIARNEQQD